MQGKVYRLLGETPPNGGEFAKAVKRILGREEAWNRYFSKTINIFDAQIPFRWKNDGCPSLSKKIEESGGISSTKIGEGGSSRRRKRKLGDVVLKELAEKRVNLGNVGLTALWNQNPDNLEACRLFLIDSAGTFLLQLYCCSGLGTETSCLLYRTTSRRL